MRKAREAFRGAFSTVLKHYYSLVLVLLTVRYKKAYKHTKRNLESLDVVYAEIGMLHLCSTLKPRSRFVIDEPAYINRPIAIDTRPPELPAGARA